MRLLFLLSLFFLAGCSQPCCYNYCTQGAGEFVLDSYKIREGKFSILELEGECIAPLPPEFLCEYQDHIDEDDILRIAVTHPGRKDLSESIACVGSSVGYRVVDGAVRLPGLDPICVRGLTLSEARRHLQLAYDQIIAHTEVFVEYETRLHSHVELTGCVKLPQIPVNGRIRLYEVISLAQIPPDANLFQSYVSRDGCLLPIDLQRLVRLGDMSQNIVMRPQDKIFIAEPTAATVLVMGEVACPRAIPLPTGAISLREALAIAGGIPFTGDKRCIQVIRGNIVCPKIYCLSWNHITYLPNDSLLLMPGDTVYISETPITKWNRFIDQLLPSGLLIDLCIRSKGVLH